MKILLKIIIVLLILVAIISVSAYIFINTKGKDLVIAQLDNILQPEVKIESLSLIFPATIQMQQVSIEKFLAVQELAIQPSLLTLLSGNIGFSKIVLVEPNFTVTKDAEGNFNFASLLKPQSGKSKPVIIGDLVIKNGNVDFIDRKIQPEGFNVKITNLNMQVKNPLNPRFKINAEIQGKESSGSFKADGWLNLLRKDMDADVELSDLDGAYFRPYFKNFLSDKKLKTATVNLKIDLSAENNTVEGKGHLEIINIAYEEPKEEVPQEEEKEGLPSIAGLIFGTEGDLPEQITMDLPIKGTLIPFRINLTKITANVFSEMLKETITKEPEKIPEKIEDIGERFKAFGKELEKVFKKESTTPTEGTVPAQ
jgi:hypothetical protein